MDKTTLDQDGYLQLAAIYGLLGRLWFQEVDLKTLEALAEPEFKESYLALGGSVPESIAEATIEDLAVDYCQLLVGPKNARPPVQSLWVDSVYQSECASRVQKFYGLLPHFEFAKSVPDHFGIQLQYLSQLFMGSAEAVADGKEPPFEEVATRFFEEHISWALPLLSYVQSRAETDFYRGLASITANLLDSDL